MKTRFSKLLCAHSKRSSHYNNKCSKWSRLYTPTITKIVDAQRHCHLIVQLSNDSKVSDKKYIANVFNHSDIFLSILEISINTTYNSTSTYYCTVKQFTSSLCHNIFSLADYENLSFFLPDPFQRTLPVTRTNPPRNNQFLNSIALTQFTALSGNLYQQSTISTIPAWKPSRRLQKKLLQLFDDCKFG